MRHLTTNQKAAGTSPAEHALKIPANTVFSLPRLNAYFLRIIDLPLPLPQPDPQDETEKLSPKRPPQGEKELFKALMAQDLEWMTRVGRMRATAK
jgi:hypothetical protein